MIKRAYTLIELSIVLIIIAFILAGVSVANELISSANAKLIIKEINDYKSKILLFKEKYGFWPGDMPNAVAQLGATYNGNGNGLVSDGYWGVTTANSYEDLYVWNHMFYAGYVTIPYTGAVVGAKNFVPGTNVPASQMQGVIYMLHYVGSPDMPIFFNRTGTALLIVGSGDSSNYYNASMLTGEIGYRIDNKIDDGSPTYGSLYALGTSCNTNQSWNAAGSGSYPGAQTRAGKNCLMWYWIDEGNS